MAPSLLEKGFRDVATGDQGTPNQQWTRRGLNFPPIGCFATSATAGLVFRTGFAEGIHFQPRSGSVQFFWTRARSFARNHEVRSVSQENGGFVEKVLNSEMHAEVYRARIPLQGFD